MDNLIPIQFILETFPDEVFFEIFDRLSPIDLYRAFFGLNKRFNKILNDFRMRFRDNISSFNMNQFQFYIQNILPQIHNRLVSFTFGTYDTDEYQQVKQFFHTYSIDLSHFKCLRTLVIINLSITDIPFIGSALVHLKNLINLRLSIDSNDVDRSSVIDLNNNFFINPRLKHVKMNMCARTIFINLNENSPIEQFSIAWCQLDELTHLLEYTPNLYTLKATICGLNSIDNWLAKLSNNITNFHLNSLKLVIDSITFDHLLLFLQKFNQLRSLWLLLNHHEYMDVNKWENLFQTYLINLDQLDLTIALIKPFLFGQTIFFSTPYDVCQKFNTKFWFNRGWGAKLDEYDHCIRLIVSNNLMPIIKKAKR